MTLSAWLERAMGSERSAGGTPRCKARRSLCERRHRIGRRRAKKGSEAVERFRPDSANAEEPAGGPEGPVRGAIGDDARRERGADPGEALELGGGRSIDVEAAKGRGFGAAGRR